MSCVDLRVVVPQAVVLPRLSSVDVPSPWQLLRLGMPHIPARGIPTALRAAVAGLLMMARR